MSERQIGGRLNSTFCFKIDRGKTAILARQGFCPLIRRDDLCLVFEFNPSSMVQTLNIMLENFAKLTSFSGFILCKNTHFGTYLKKLKVIYIYYIILIFSDYKQQLSNKLINCFFFKVSWERIKNVSNF